MYINISTLTVSFYFSRMHEVPEQMDYAPTLLNFRAPIQSSPCEWRPLEYGSRIHEECPLEVCNMAALNIYDGLEGHGLNTLG